MEKTSVQVYVEENDLFWDIKRQKKLINLAEAVKIVADFYRKNKK